MSELQANFLLAQIYEKRKKAIKVEQDIEHIIDGLAFRLYILFVLVYLFIVSRYLNVNSFDDIFSLYNNRCDVNKFLISINLFFSLFVFFAVVLEAYCTEQKGKFIESIRWLCGIALYTFALVLYQSKCLSRGHSLDSIFGQFFNFILYYVLMVFYSSFLMLCGFGLFYISLVILRELIVLLVTSPKKITLYFLSKSLGADVGKLQILIRPIISSTIRFMGGGTLDEVYKEVCKAVNFTSKDLLEYFLQRIEDIEIVQLNEDIFYKSREVSGGSNMKTVILDDE